MSKGFKSYKLIFTSDTTGTVEQLDKLDRALSSSNYQYNQLKNNLLKGGYNPTKFKQAQTECQKAVQASSDKLQLLLSRMKEMEANGQTEGKYAKPYKALLTEIEKAQKAALKAENQIKQLDKIKLDSIKKTIQDVSSNLNKIGKNMTTYVTVPLIAAGAASINMASDMEESTNKVEVCFGDAAKSIIDFSETTLTTYGIAKSTALNMAATFGDMATSMGYSQQEAADMAKTLVGLAGDVASFKNISLDEAQTALSGIFTGETETLKKLGVVMTETNVKAYALSKGITKKYSEMSQGEKVALRYEYVMRSLSNSQGDFSRTSDNTANQLRILSESLKELAAIAGEELIPIVLPVIQKINEILQSVGELDSGTKELITKTAIFVATLGPCLTITGKITGAVGNLVTAYHSLKAAQTAAAAGQTAVNTAMNLNPINAVISAVGVLISVLGALAISNSLVEKSVGDIIDSYKNAVNSIDDTARKEEAELKIVEKLIPRYDELNKKTNKTTTEKNELANIVEQINSILPNSITLINAEKGAYDGVTSAIYNTIEAKKQEIAISAARDKAIQAQKSQMEILEEGGFSSYTDLKANYNLALRASGGKIANHFDPGDWILEKAGIIDAGYRAAELKELLEEYESLQKVIDKYTSTTVSTKSTYSTKTSGNSYSTSSSSSTSNYDPFEYQYQLNKDRLSLDLISEKQYYANLEKLYKTYYKKNSEEYRKYQIEVYEGRKKLAEQEAENLKQLQEDMLNDFEEYANKIITLAEQEANAKIAAIDAELAAREKLKASQKQELKLQQAMAQLAFTTDAESRKNLEKEIKRLKEDIATTQATADAEAKKAAIQAQLEQIKSHSSQLISNMTSQLSPAESNPYLNQINTSNIINANGLSVAQVKQMLEDIYNKILYNI